MPQPSLEQVMLIEVNFCTLKTQKPNFTHTRPVAPILCLDNPRDPPCKRAGRHHDLLARDVFLDSPVAGAHHLVLEQNDPLEGKPNTSVRLSGLPPQRSILRQCSPRPRVFDIHVSSRPSLQLPISHLNTCAQDTKVSALLKMKFVIASRFCLTM
ncbi:hypothetical protein BD779DRAFT_1180166 [Infundibulicybe gibba]|nr:hypothetical protein BD779DRAFT_1180166 [Infundibulicybe gibba]